MPYFVTILNFEAAILDISELYVYDILHIAFLDYLNKIGHFDSLIYGFVLYKCHSQYSKWRPSWNPIWRPYGTFFSLAPILKRFSAFFSFRVPNFMLCSQSPRFFHQSAQLYYIVQVWWLAEVTKFHQIGGDSSDELYRMSDHSYQNGIGLDCICYDDTCPSRLSSVLSK